MHALSIIVPSHNEAKNIPLLLERFLHLSKEHSFELIVVNNASTDDSLSVLRHYVHQPEFSFLKVIDEPTPGYGRAIMTGLRAATGDVLSWTHADLQTDPKDTIRAYELFLKHGQDTCVVKGNRRGRPFFSWAFTLGMSVVASIVLRGLYTDINAQPKLFSRSFFEQYMKDAPDDFSLDLYLLSMAKRHGYSLLTFPVSFEKRVHGVSSWAFSWKSRWKTITRTMTYIFRLQKSLKHERR